MNDLKEQLLELYYEFYRVFGDVIRAYNTPGAATEYDQLTDENQKRWSELLNVRRQLTGERDCLKELAFLLKIFTNAEPRLRRLWEAHVHSEKANRNMLRHTIAAIPDAAYNQIDLYNQPGVYHPLDISGPNGLKFPWSNTYLYWSHPDKWTLPPVDSRINEKDNEHDDMDFIDFQGLDD